MFFPLNVLNLAVKYGAPNYITIGTSLPAEFNLYSFTKNKFSEFGKYLCEKNRINFADLKVEMFYGGSSEPNERFIRSCMIKLKKNEDLLLTEGFQKRDIVRVEDVASIIGRLINSDYISGYKTLPIGSGENHSIKEIVNYMKKMTGSNSRLIFWAISSRENEPDTLADITWYKDIDYRLQYAYFDGLKKECCEFLEENHR